MKPIKTVRRLGGGVPRLALASCAAWTAYSATFIPHDVPLPRPVPGNAGHIDTLTAGRVAVYQMGPSGRRRHVLR